MAEKQMQQIVRIAGVDIDASKPLGHQLTNIRGVGTSYANLICNILGISKLKKGSELSDEEIKRIEKALSNPEEFGAPSWMINRRKDPESGADMHLIGNDLKFTQDNDIKTMRKIRSYKGIRHSSRLPVRGQKTKSNFRSNKGKAMGVKRKK